ncbi:MAG: rod shape-determining protein RodA [Nodosilinea sp.]|nr:rod shape-determining protein RodA [Cyanobacteriota bacterium]
MLNLQWQKRWQFLLEGWQEVDWLLFLLPSLLVGFSSLVLSSIQTTMAGTRYDLNHLGLGVVCLGLALWIARSRYERLQEWYWIIYGLTNASLVLVMLIGTVGNGAQSWIGVGGFYLQPSEFAKVGVIICLAVVLSRRDASTLPGLGAALGITALPWGLVFVQPDLGTSLVFGAILLAMLYWANCKPGWLVLLVSPLVAAIVFNLSVPAWLLWSAGMGAIAWYTLPWRWLSSVLATAISLISGKLGQVFWGLLEDYQKDRLVLFLDPHKDPLGGGYHLIQSRIAIGAGRLWGQGLRGGTQTQLDFIPEQHTDFIFSAVGEEWGFVGCMVVLLAYLLIFFRLVVIAQNAKDNFGSLLAIGVFAMILFQATVNIGMTIGLAPITGIPLPWLSYGRSSLLTNFVALGIVESVANFRHRLKFTD